MRKPQQVIFTSFIMTLLVLGAAGCSHNKPKAEETATDPGINSALDHSDFGSSDEGKAFGLKTVFFAYDASDLNSATQGDLKKNSDILKAHSNLKIQIEGHCDERGGVQYNMALGEHRARAVMDYLVGQGVPAANLSIISFGKEKPLVSGDTEEAYAKNRRANFAIIEK